MNRILLLLGIVVTGLLASCNRQSAPPRDTSAAAPQNSTAPRTIEDVNRLADSERPQDSLRVRDAAMELLRQGNAPAAEEMVRDQLATIEEASGTNSREYAWTQFDLATVYLASGMSEKAVESLRAACAVKIPDDHQAAKDRLTFLMNLGEILSHDEQFAAAEQVLRESLVEREAFYGRDHPGYAYGLAPLADVLLQQNQLDEALTLAEQAVSNLLQNQHPQIVSSMALRAEILATRGDHTSLYAHHEMLSNELLVNLIQMVGMRISADRPEIGRLMLDELYSLATARLGEFHPNCLDIIAQQTNVERLLGNHPRRIELLNKLVTAYESQGETLGLIQVVQALAAAHDDMGDIAAYLTAARKAEASGFIDLHSDVIRCHGLMLAQKKRHDEARAQLEKALNLAQTSNQKTLIAVSQVALGIFYQHQGDKQQAASLLEQALTVLDPLSADALCGRSHLTAIKTNADCGCNESTMQSAMAEAIKIYISERAPQGLLTSIQVTFGEQHSWTVTFETSRPPTAEEQQEVDRLVEHAHAHFQRQVRQGFFSPAYERLRN